MMIEHARRRTWWRRAVVPALERLESRQLLSAVYTGPSTVRTVQSSGGVFSIQVSGPGVIKENSAGRSGIDLSAFGTTNATTITITQIRPRWHFPSQYLVLKKVRITSGQLGGFDAGLCRAERQDDSLERHVEHARARVDRAQGSDRCRRQRGHDDRLAGQPGPDRPRGDRRSAQHQ